MSIEVKNLSFSYADRQVLHDISFKVGQGEFVSILGPNGVGKSTLFRCMLGLLSGYSGQVLVNGLDRRKMSVRQCAKEIAYIPQSSSPAFNYSVFDIVLMGSTPSLAGFRSPSAESRERCEWALDKIGITELSQRCFHRLSGGERQLVMIARALTQNAPILMLDEPTANLDFGNQLRVLQQMKSLSREGYTIIQTTHHPEKSFMFSDRILAVSGGKLLLDGKPSEVLTDRIMHELYGVEVDILSLYDDKARICIPSYISEKER